MISHPDASPQKTPDTPPKPAPKRRQWTDAQRQAAADRARQNRPWQHSTGPRTVAGKRRAARNSYKHGYFTMEHQVLRWYIRLAALRVKVLRQKLEDEKEILRNELNARAAKRKADIDYAIAFARKYPNFFDS